MRKPYWVRILTAIIIVYRETQSAENKHAIKKKCLKLEVDVTFTARDNNA